MGEDRKRRGTDPKTETSDSTCVSFFLSGYICVGFTLCSGPVRLPGSCSDGSVSLGLQLHRKDPCGLSI